MQQIPSVRLLRGETAEPLLIRTIRRDSGVERWNLLKAAPVLDERGRLEATIMLIEDVTEQKREQQRSAFLAEASVVLASSLDYEQTLQNVAWLAVPEIADWCGVDLIDADGDRVPVAVAHVDPARLKLADDLRRYPLTATDMDHGLGRVLRTGESMLYPEIPEEMLLRAAVSDEHLALLRAVEMRSVAIVPISLGKKTLGAMTLVGAESGRVLDRADLELAEQIASRAAVAIENSRLYSERSAIARTLQKSLLPERLPEIPGYELAGAYLPALEGTEVGGDFYDAWGVPAKAKKVESLAADLSGTVSLVVTEYRGLKVGELQELRRRLRPRGIEYHIVKNSLFARAADQSGKGELRSLLAGPTAVAIGDGDEVELAKSLVDETRVLKTLKILGALIGGRALGADDVQSLARLPSRPQLQATIVGSLQAPLAQIVGVLTAAQGNLVRVLQARGSQ